MAATSAAVGVVGQLAVPCDKRSNNSSYRDSVQEPPAPFLRTKFLTSLGNVKLQKSINFREKSSRNSMATKAALSTDKEKPVTKAIDFKKLQNGSDIRGVAVAGVQGEPVTLTEPVTEAIAVAFSGWLRQKKNVSASAKLKVAIGHDSRISADVLQVKIETAAARGLKEEGFDVVLFGLASTPAMFNSTMTEQADLQVPVDGSIMLTASHLPYNRNGLKFFTNGGGLAKGDISDILARASKIYDKKMSSPSSDGPAFDLPAKVDYMARYTDDLVGFVRKGAFGLGPQGLLKIRQHHGFALDCFICTERPLDGFHIVVDAGNGAGGFFAEQVLVPLGATTTGSQFLEPDGMFPNHIPNPENEKAMKAITDAVLEQKADLGIIFDTDVDRSAAVDSGGRELNRNRLIALMAAIVLEEHPGTTIVTDSVTSDGLTTFIEQKLGGKHHRFKRGYKNVIDEGIRLNQVGVEAHLAIETSGHGAMKENNWLDDGAYLMVKLLIKLAAAKVAGEGKGSEALSKLIGELKEAEVASELRFTIDQSHPDLGEGTFQEYGEKVLAKLDSVVELDSTLQKAPVNYEGIRVAGFGGWFLLRLSLHDPVLPLNIEAHSKDAAGKLAAVVLKVVEDFKALDISSLIKYVESMS